MRHWHTIIKQLQSRSGIIVFALLIASASSATVWALTNSYMSQETEAGTRSGNVTIISDATASSGSAIKFGEAAVSSCPVPDRVTVTSANIADYPAYPVNTKLYVPGGPDPWGGCFPSQATTGYPHGLPGDTRTPVTLTNYTGPCVITTANTVIDKKNISCGIIVQAANVTITNSNIAGQIRIDDCSQSYSFSVSDTTIVYDWIASRGLRDCNYTATRVDISGGGSMAICSNCTIKDSYLHDPLEDPNGKAHNSTVRIGANAVIEHNTLHCAVKMYAATDGSGETSGCSANQTAYSHDGLPPYNSTLRRNFYMAITDGYCAYGGSTGGSGASQVHDIKFIQNIFQRGATPAYSWSPTAYICGTYGPITSLDDMPGNEFTGNTWDNGKPLSGVQNTWAANPGNPSAGPCNGAPANCTW